MSEDNIFREIDEELRSDRMRQIWRRYAPYVIGAAVAVVLLVAVNEGWNWWQNSNAARSSDQLYTAFEQAEAGDVSAAQETLAQLQQNGSGNYPLLAEFRAAGVLVDEGQLEEAVAAYDALSGSAGNQHMRELALVLAGFVLVDIGDVDAVEARVQGVIDSGSALRNTAREALGLAQYKAGDLEAAKATFEAISADPGGAMDQLNRVQLYLAQLAAEGVGVEQDAAEVEQSAEEDAAAETPAAEVPAGTEETAE